MNPLRGRLLLLLLLTAPTWAVPNPVLPDTADCGVMRFGGQYYLMGVKTHGGVYVSDDLVTWTGPVHVFSMANDWTPGPAGEDKEIHACDLSLRDGRFHLYWSVNYHELRQIGHAVADSPLGPYVEPVTDKPLDGRIDPHIFNDEKDNLFFYTVKFTNGNVVWGQHMTDPWTLRGDPVPLLEAVPGTWELQDHRVNEAPWVVGHRGRYYMLYNGNHTWEGYGHYAIGLAVAGTPLGFSNANKYPLPVLDSNRERILESAHLLAPASTSDGHEWRYTNETPPEGWAAPDFDDAAWDTGNGAFGNPGAPAMRCTVRTPWRGNDIWIRGAFDLERLPSEHTQIFLSHNKTAEAYVNGVKAYDNQRFLTGYAAVDLPPAARAALRVGKNTLAIHASHGGTGPRYIDAGLIDPRNGPGEPVVHNCGQPSLVRGPNGFEWWLVYFALFNGNHVRAQAIDRVFFFGQTLFVDGPTTERTPGYHPKPAPPTFGDGFETGGRLSAAWPHVAGDWRAAGGVVEQTRQDGDHIAIIQPEGTHYVIETALKLLGEEGQAGLVVWQKDRDSLCVGLDRSRQCFFYDLRTEGGEAVRRPMSTSFHWPGGTRSASRRTTPVAGRGSTVSP